MKKILIPFLMAAPFVATGSAVQTFTGVITGSMSGADHKPMKMGSDPSVPRNAFVPAVARRSSNALYDAKQLSAINKRRNRLRDRGHGDRSALLEDQDHSGRQDRGSQ